MDNIEINLLLKVKNIIGGSSFKDRMNIFQKKSTILPSENPSNAIITGINMKDRLKLFNSTNYSSSNYSKSKTVIISNKSNQPIIEKPEKNNDNKNLINKEKKIEEKIDYSKTNINNDKNEEKKIDIIKKEPPKENIPVKENDKDKLNQKEEEPIKKEEIDVKKIIENDKKIESKKSINEEKIKDKPKIENKNYKKPENKEDNKNKKNIKEETKKKEKENNRIKPKESKDLKEKVKKDTNVNKKEIYIKVIDLEEYEYNDEWEYSFSGNDTDFDRIYDNIKDFKEEWYEEVETNENNEQNQNEKDNELSKNLQKDNNNHLLSQTLKPKDSKELLKEMNINSDQKNNKINSKLSGKKIANFERTMTVQGKEITDLGFEILDTYEEDINPSSTMSTSMDSTLPENILESTDYESYIKEYKLANKSDILHETFCSGFFIASFPKKNGEVIENISKFPASCGHEECSQLPAMKPEIIFRYPLKDNKNLELNNLAATICFPTGIKACYSETTPPKQLEDYVTQITNQKGERYYMRTFHFYEKRSNIDLSKDYEMHPLKYHLSKFGDEFLLLKDDQFTEEITNHIQKILDFCQELGNRDIVYIPYCLCLISKYPYIAEMGKCLDTIYRIIGTKPEMLNFEINDLIMYLINSIPIPDKNTKIQFFLPYCNNPKIELQCPKIDDISIMNSNFMGLFKYLSIDNIVLIFRLILFEKKLLFIHNDYTELTNITNSFISLLYPFQWIHTYIPIMSAQMLKYLETFLPFLNGIHESLMNSVEKLFKEEESGENEEIILIYIQKGEIVLSSSFQKNKNKLSKFIQNNIPPLPFEKELKKELKIIESNKNKIKNDILENKIRDAFISVFVKMFYDYEKYIINLDNEVVFNKVLFMKNLPIKEEKTDQFFNEFLDSQLFEQFTQNINDTENSYFKRKIKEYKEKENKNNKKPEKEKNISNTMNKKDINYLASPYIGLKNSDKNSIETIIEAYKVTEGENKEIKNKIIENEINIDSKKYINKKCIIYYNPEKKESIKEEEKKNKSKKREAKLGGMTEKQLEQMKDNIKETVINIFKSQIEKDQIKSLKKKVFSNLETPAGRSFFVSLISNNNNNISLQEDSFLFLEELIKGILNSALKSEETDQLIEEIVKLIISTGYFESVLDVESKDNKEIKINIFSHMKNFLRSYNKITQKNLWKKWYDLELKRKMEECSDENENKENIILNICENMISFQISKSNIKNVVENINKIVFGEGTELYEKVKKEYINLITKANYISEATNY